MSGHDTCDDRRFLHEKPRSTELQKPGRCNYLTDTNNLFLREGSSLLPLRGVYKIKKNNQKPFGSNPTFFFGGTSFFSTGGGSKPFGSRPALFVVGGGGGGGASLAFCCPSTRFIYSASYCSSLLCRDLVSGGAACGFGCSAGFSGFGFAFGLDDEAPRLYPPKVLSGG